MKKNLPMYCVLVIVAVALVISVLKLSNRVKEVEKTFLEQKIETSATSTNRIQAIKYSPVTTSEPATSLINQTPTLEIKVRVVEKENIEESDCFETETVEAESFENEVNDFASDEVAITLSEADIFALAQTLYGEANCVESEAERSMVIWTILNRLDSGRFGDTVYEICSSPMQFTGYDPYHPITDRNLDTVYDVVSRWEREKAGEEWVGRTIPSNFCYFAADSDPAIGEWHNAFYAYTGGDEGEKIWYPYLDPICNPYES